MSVSTTFDLLLRGGRVIDPASSVDGIKDVAIRNGKIAAIAVRAAASAQLSSWRAPTPKR